MNFSCQTEAISNLNTLAVSKRQSILIEGSSGCGKTYLARMYASMLQVEDFISVQPKVSDLRETIDKCTDLETPTVVCVENLDCGVISAAYVILKFLEEPLPDTYVVVTCRNINKLPDTIVSRSAVISVNHPTSKDLNTYASSKNNAMYAKYSVFPLWKCVRTFKDVDTVLTMTDANIKYFNDLAKLKDTKDSISNISWLLGHYDDNSETPLELVIRYVMEIIPTPVVRKCGIDCITDLLTGTIAKHAVLAKFAFNLKYIE